METGRRKYRTEKSESPVLGGRTARVNDARALSLSFFFSEREGRAAVFMRPAALGGLS